jgi:ketosteroid isomerase-like protein
MADDRDFSELTAGLDRAASELAPGARQHVRTIGEQLDAIARGDFGSVFQDAHDDVTFEIFAPPEFPFIKTANGAEELNKAIVHNFGAIADQRPTIRETFAEGDTVILFGTETGKIKETGFRYHVEFVERFTFRDGRLASLRIIAAHCRER